MDKVSYAGQNLLRWRVGKSTFLALPEKGARLMNWNITLGDGSVRDVLYWPEDANFAEIAHVRGGNPILFPFSARTFDRGDIQFWRAADGIRRPMPMHGLARQGAFRLTQADAAGFTALFLPDDAARTAYPYDYEFTVRYRFESLGLICEFALSNLGTVPLPWSAGHHFYFTLPWSEGLKRSDYSIRIPARQCYRHDAAGRLAPGPELAEVESMDNPGLTDAIRVGLRENTVVFGERGHAGDVIITLGAEKVPPPDAAVVTWTQSDDAPFYCVEPWMGPPNAPEHKRGLHLVPPGTTQTFTVAVRVK
ncbi:MAG: aldose epimerase [Opitutales bacterium]